ncbi:MAG: nuclear transport factor 2 family protein [Tomitella sp.]|nr:nuclear transport factor 2 family protein [Tomitella sp.]
MSPAPDSQTLLATVEESPAAVAVHDREAWLELFSPDAEVCDPVGSRPNRGRAELTAFYETFIAPNDITFHVDHDVVVKDTVGRNSVSGNTVFRDLTLETVMGGRSGPNGTTAPDDVALQVPMHLRYDVVDVEGRGRSEDLRLSLLHAHWELPSMIRQLLGHGPSGMLAGTKLVPLLMRNQRISGSIGYARAFQRAGRTGKTAAYNVFTALSTGQDDTLDEILVSGTRIETPGRGDGAGESVREFASRGHDLQWRKLISAGMTVTATIELDGERGVALFDFGRRHDLINRVRLFLPS